MSQIEEMFHNLKEYEKHMNVMWEYWDDVLRSWKMLERHRLIVKLQERQIKEFKI